MTKDAPAPTSRALRALARKYHLMAELRRAGAPSETDADRARLRALAREFPGALRELDTLATAEIDRRGAALEASAAGAPPEPWMAWMDAYHGLMRAALETKVRLRPGVAPRDLERMAGDIARATGIAVDAAFVRALARPPDGRISVVVFARLGERFGEPPETLWNTLFPPRRPGRY